LQVTPRAPEEVLHDVLALLELAELALPSRHPRLVLTLPLDAPGFGVRVHSREGRPRVVLGLGLSCLGFADRRLASCEGLVELLLQARGAQVQAIDLSPGFTNAASPAGELRAPSARLNSTRT
jgi:hypothetical protein